MDRPVDLLSEKTVITLFQYITFFAEEERRHPEKFISDLTKECKWCWLFSEKFGFLAGPTSTNVFFFPYCMFHSRGVYRC